MHDRTSVPAKIETVDLVIIVSWQNNGKLKLKTNATN